MQTEIRQSFEKLFPKKQITTHAIELLTYEVDAGLDHGAPEGVAFPQSPEDVARLMRWANAHNVPLIARGAGTGLSGGAVAERGGVIVEFSRMNRVIELDVRGRSAVIEPGILNLVFDGIVKQSSLYYPPDPASQRASTIGGNVAENAGGPHCFKYGVTTNYVTGLNLVLADGRAMRVGGRALDFPEYDFIGLLVGSEGTLALITSIDVRLIANPPGVKTMMAGFDSVRDAGNAVSAVIAAGLVPATMEMMDQRITRIVEDVVHTGLPTDAGAVLIIEADGYPASLDSQIEEIADLIQANGARQIRIAQSEEERARIWYGRKSVAGSIARVAAGNYTVDITVPRSRLAETLTQVDEVIARHKLDAGHLLHAGDGNFHPLILVRDLNDARERETIVQAGREIAAIGVRANGSITGEHGVGIEKREFMTLMHNADELNAMWDVKQVFDPRGLLNPGKIFPTQMPEIERARAEGDLPGDMFTPATIEEAARGIVALGNANRRAMITSNSEFGIRNSEFTRLSPENLVSIKAYAPDDLYITVGAGMLLAELQEFLARDHKQVALASPFRDATLGGVVASNANAPLRMRYGALRDLVLAMTVVLGDGRIIRAGRPVVKNVAGYDLPKVFVGSFGTLGLIADVTFKIAPQPRARRTLLVPVNDCARGIEIAERVLPGALVASAVLIAQTSDWRLDAKRGDWNAPYALVYSAEGIREDVETEIANVRAVLRAVGASSPVESEVSGTEIWAGALESALHEARVIARVGVPVKELANFVATQSDSFAQNNFVVDVANGLVYATRRAGDDVRAWLTALREPAIARGGYAIVMHAPEKSRAALDGWGAPPESLALMRALQARWDPSSVFNSGAFFI
ncbi:MAG: FAD-binding protein [Chloroflexi bacterium]|nr:FAD-binding protein [Chloroflexota bacterium]